MKRKLAYDGSMMDERTVGPRYSQEEAERLKAILRTRADNQFELDKLFHDSPTVRHQTRQKLERLLIQAEAAETMAPGLQRDMSKMASVTDEEAKILGLEKRALSGETVGSALSKRIFQENPNIRNRDEGAAAGRAATTKRPIYESWIANRPDKIEGVSRGLARAAEDKARERGVSGASIRKARRAGLFRKTVRMGEKGIASAAKNYGKAFLSKAASIAPNVDAWFEKHAGIPAPATSAKATRVTVSARPGRSPAQSNLAGGSA